MKQISYLVCALALATLTLSGCLKKNFDAPADSSGYDPQLPVTHTIQQLLAMNGAFYTTDDDTTLITQDITIAGIVTADDRSGNFYKRIVMQDSTAGIQVLIDAYSLYNDYPVGRKIYIHCKGLYLGYDGGTPVLGISVNEQRGINEISGNQIADHIVKGNVGNTVPADTVSLAAVRSFNAAYLNKLIVIRDAEFEDTTKPYTEPTATTNRYIEDCFSASLVVRTSNYANFSAYPMPAGRGSIAGVYTVYTSTFNGSKTPQLIIRDTTDVKFNNYRCGAGPVVPGALISLDSVRNIFTHSGASGIMLGNYMVHGVVISDAANKNVSSRNVVLQDGNKGITVYFTSNVTYNIGDSIVLDVTGDSLVYYQGAMEIKYPAAPPAAVATGKIVLPVQLTIAQLNANFANYESTLVKIVNATLTGGATYGTASTLSDGTGTVQLYTSTSALFAGQAIPTTAKTFTGIETPYNGGPELKLRNPTLDVY